MPWAYLMVLFEVVMDVTVRSQARLSHNHLAPEMTANALVAAFKKKVSAFVGCQVHPHDRDPFRRKAVGRHLGEQLGFCGSLRLSGHGLVSNSGITT
eukprot:9633147-Alexandrium_andersonii.AAC.1